MSEELYLNGIDADTGGPIDGEMVITTEKIAEVARGHRISKEDQKDIQIRKSRDANNLPNFGTIEGIDESDISQTGWSVIFPASLPQKSVDAIKDALKPLLDLRKEQAALANEKYYKEVVGTESGYRNGESKNEFLKRFGRGPGPADPDYFPYYALIVGSPETIPFSFQYQLDVQYAVGRIYFEKLDEYYQYATSVVAAETKKYSRGKKAAFFGVANPEDRATGMSSEYLIKPLANEITLGHPDWSIDLVNPIDATKANLANYLGGAQTPALLFSASHGMSFKIDDPRLLAHTGALLTQDWPGPKVRGPVSDKMYFSADDIPTDADVFGLIAFIFACYGGGIPKSDNFYRQAFGEQKEIAPYSFLSRLPLKLLSHPRGGALGVFAHVERAWGSSIQWDGAVNDYRTFKSMADTLLAGKPAGAATEVFNQRYAEISTELTQELDTTTPEMQDDVKLASMWTSNNDARNYTFVGDPAVRISAGEKVSTKAVRESISVQVSKVSVTVSNSAASFQPDIIDRTIISTTAQPTMPATNYNVISDLFKKEDVPANTETASVTGRAVNDTLKNFIEKLGSYLSKALDDATSLEVSTYVADDLSTVQYDAGKFSGAQLRALTRINIDGDTMVCLPEKDGEVDTAVWNIHLDIVKSAQANRAEMMKTIVNAATSIAGIIK